MKYTRSQTETAMKTLTKAMMITTMKTTRGMIITVCNYELYQNPKNYDNRNENPNESHDGNHNENHTIKEEVKEVEEEKELSASTEAVGCAESEFYTTTKKRKLTGKRLETFKRFWKAFRYTKGRAGAADAWIDIPELTNALVEKIIKAAEREAKERPSLIATKRTPIWGQGWITERRWEDEPLAVDPNDEYIGTPYENVPRR